MRRLPTVSLKVEYQLHSPPLVRLHPLGGWTPNDWWSPRMIGGGDSLCWVGGLFGPHPWNSRINKINLLSHTYSELVEGCIFAIPAKLNT
jgi:hypothetical protein